MRLFLLLCLGIFSLFSCKTPSYTPEDFPEGKITFGSGGGFTGIYTDYVLLENGQFFRKSSNEKEFIALPKIGKNKVSQVFKNVTTLKLMSLNFNNPGNMNTYVKMKIDGQEQEITWGVPGPKPPKDAKLFYKILMNLVKNKKS